MPPAPPGPQSPQGDRPDTRKGARRHIGSDNTHRHQDLNDPAEKQRVFGWGGQSARDRRLPALPAR